MNRTQLTRQRAVAYQSQAGQRSAVSEFAPVNDRRVWDADRCVTVEGHNGLVEVHQQNRASADDTGTHGYSRVSFVAQNDAVIITHYQPGRVRLAAGFDGLKLGVG
jgi:hypothetical protein